ncbi:hypothetical protein ILUMI_11436 [Ignelater luminosus]|uniref:Uncharacterized protein n=1 Tax=Ignelater luminosus TaxID=2038154 RepID=A0A8K0GD89_IGNLU|nr:hypothetical protein ILUMI_11436 [Ignelater luminosus]
MGSMNNPLLSIYSRAVTTSLICWGERFQHNPNTIQVPKNVKTVDILPEKMDPGLWLENSMTNASLSEYEKPNPHENLVSIQTSLKNAYSEINKSRQAIKLLRFLTKDSKDFVLKQESPPKQKLSEAKVSSTPKQMKPKVESRSAIPRRKVTFTATERRNRDSERTKPQRCLPLAPKEGKKYDAFSEWKRKENVPRNRCASERDADKLVKADEPEKADKKRRVTH